ncbi:porin [Dechloromonas sp. ZS-1]|uniref:porin n=1 Tax=Dechloromonas sp. ZS-1 TaxID=3138067 RepID=UPI0031FC2BC6
MIALALAAVAGSAAAQTNVTVYGVVDLGQAFVKSSGNAAATPSNNQSTVGRLDSNSSYIGFKGVEDLGNGLKAVFQIESTVAPDNTGAIDNNRDSFVGLTGGFGTAVAGTLTHPLRAFGAKVELAPAAAGFGTTASLTGAIKGVKSGADDRAKNAVAYVSPSFGGFTGTVAYVNGETQKNGADQAEARSFQVAGQYDNGPLFVGAGYHKAVNSSAAGTLGNDNADARVYRLAAVYTLPTATKLTALYDNTKADTDVAGGYLKRNAFSLGVAQSFGKNTVGLEYAKAAKTKTEAGEVANSGASLWTAVYTYELSKRTIVHARYSHLANKDGVNYAFYNNPVNNGTTNGNGADYTGYMVGLRHSF